MLGEHAAAVTHYRAAAGRTTSIAERNYLTTLAARLPHPADVPDG